jgi:hypothetical protein
LELKITTCKEGIKYSYILHYMKDQNIPWSAYGNLSTSVQCRKVAKPTYVRQPKPRCVDDKRYADNCEAMADECDQSNVARMCAKTCNKCPKAPPPRRIPGRVTYECKTNGQRAAQKIIQAQQPEIMHTKDIARKMFHTLHDQYLSKLHQLDTQQHLLGKQSNILYDKQEKINDQEKLLDKSNSDLHTKRRLIVYDEGNDRIYKTIFNTLKLILLITSGVVIFLVYKRIKTTPRT